MIITMGYVTSSVASLTALRSQTTNFPKQQGLHSKEFGDRCAQIAAEYFDMRRPVLAQKGDNACVPSERFACFEVENGIMIRYPILPNTGQNRQLSPSERDPRFLEPSLPSIEMDVDHLQLAGGPQARAVEVLHGLNPEFLFSTLVAGAPGRSTYNVANNMYGVYAAGVDQLNTALGYSVASPLGNNGIYFRQYWR